jgi:UTP:GlnB (protein PII) uridylyltransferase
VLRRIADAPHAYLLAERPRRVARHAELVASWKRRGRDQYLVNVEPPTRHDPRVALEVVAPDSPGLLARVAHVLTAAGLDVDNAIVATWPDGCALESFLLRATEVPDAGVLREAVKEADSEAIGIPGFPDARIEFDDGVSPWSTVVKVRVLDAPGTLGAVAGAIAAADVDVHSAEIRTEGGFATDTFELTGARGKLTADQRGRIIENIRYGVILPGRRRGLGRAWDMVRSTWVSDGGQMADIRT